MHASDEHNAIVCKHSRHTSPAIIARYGCPAEAAVRFVNTVIARFSGDLKLAEIEEEFPKFVARELRTLFPVAAVFWSPRREKLMPAEAQRQLESLSLKKKSGFHDKLNELLIYLNSGLHSGSFLHLLERHTRVGQSRCFEVAPHAKGIRFRAIAQDTLASGRKKIDEDLEVVCASRAVSTPTVFFEAFRAEWTPKLTESTTAQAMKQLREYLTGWKDVAPGPEVFLQGRWKTGGHAHNREVVIEGKRALQHFALMCLFMLNNTSSSATYFLSPTIQGQYDSSMVIYWGAGADPPRSFVYLLSILLGLNASPILQAMTRQDVLNSAFRNSGHTMRNRCDSIAQYFDKNEPAWHRRFREDIATTGKPPEAFDKKGEQLDRDYDKA